VTDNLTFLKTIVLFGPAKKMDIIIFTIIKKGKLKTQITKGNWEVTAYYGYNEMPTSFIINRLKMDLSIEMFIQFD